LTPAWTSWAATDTGTVRAGNEDRFVDRPDARLWAVADGAGGQAHGEVASDELKLTLEAPVEVTGAELMSEVRARVTAVHHALRRRADAESEALGLPIIIASTLVVLLTQDTHFACLWCGDSRAYLLRDGALMPLTRDHSLVQEMVDTGALDGALAEQHPQANVLTRAVGGGLEAPELDKITGLVEPGDRFVLCSDGLFKALDQETIGRLAAGADPARALIDAALAAAARDNVTAVVVAPEFAAAEDAT
jgi:serine/threonine protein phosphatase PrpC